MSCPASSNESKGAPRLIKGLSDASEIRVSPCNSAFAPSGRSAPGSHRTDAPHMFYVGSEDRRSYDLPGFRKTY